jgi:hypothetical protein
MTRPPLLIKRDQRLVIKLTPAEYALLQTRADTVGSRLANYARSVLLQQETGRQAIAAVSRYDRLVYSEWHRVGSNLNQVTRQLNSFGSVQASEVEAVLRDIRALIARVPE